MATVTREHCIKAAQAGGLPKADAVQAVDTLLKDKARAEVAKAEGKVADTGRALADSWTRRMMDEQVEKALKRKQAAINVLKRQELETRIAAVKAEGFTGLDAVESILVGSNRRFFGARDSVDARRVGIYKDSVGGLFNELDGLADSPTGPVLQLMRDEPEFNNNVIREIIKPESTGDASARQVADVLSRYMEQSRLRLNEAGANIGKLDRYLPQSHDPWKLTQKRTGGKSPREAWIDTALDVYDLEHSFPEIHTNAEELNKVLGSVYDNITVGKDNGPGALERGQPQGPRNIASGMGKHRVLHFKDADSFIRYNAEYGRGGILSGVLHHLDASSRKLSLMEMLGPTPERMLKSLMAEDERSLRAALAGGEITPEQQTELKFLQSAWADGSMRSGKVAAWFSELTGEASWAANPTAARAMSLMRASQTLAKLGGAALSATADVFVKAMNMRVHGLSWGEALVESTTQYFKSYKGEERAVARQVGAFVDAVSAEMKLRWDVNEALPGKIADLQDKLFRWSGLNWITEAGKAGYALWFSGHLGEVSGKAWDALPGGHKAVLEHHGFDAVRWELVRQMTETTEDGRVLLTPQAAEGLSIAALRGYAGEKLEALQKTFKNDPEGLARAEARLLERTRRDLRTDVMSMITDETLYAIIEPDAKTRAFMRQGTRPGTVPGEFWRTIMQFKSFPIAYMQRQMGGRRWVRGELQQGMRHGWNAGSGKDSVTRDMPGVVGAALSAYAFGYLAMTAKDVARGKEPRDPFRLETTLSALAQSGGAGIIGDFFLGKVDRFGNSFAGTLTGPLVGEVGRLPAIAGQLLRGEFEDAGEDGLRLVLDNAPMINLWYTREALNWSLLYHMREMLSPGTLARTERKMKEEYGQDFIISPAGMIRRGGGF